MFAVLVGDKVPGDLKDEFLQILSVEPFEYTMTFDDAVASGSESGFQTVEKLEPNDKPFHLFWVTWGVRDGCEYQIKIPTGTDRLGVDEDKGIARITNRHSPYFSPDPALGFWLIPDHFPSINAINHTLASLTPKIYFKGFKYDIELVRDDELLKRLRNFEKRDSPYVPSKKITLGGVS